MQASPGVRVVYQVRPLSSEAIDQAYPLALMAGFGHFSPAEWQRFCRIASEPDRTAVPGLHRVLGAFGPGDYLRGLCIVDSAPKAVGGPVLSVSVLVLASALDPCGVALDMLRTLMKLCRSTRHYGLSLRLPADDSVVRQAFGEALCNLVPEIGGVRLVLHSAPEP